MNSRTSSSPSILANVIRQVVKHTENEHKYYMLREDQGPSEEEIESFSNQIILTELEKKIVNLLNDCKRAIDGKFIFLPASSTIYEHHHFTKGSILDNLHPNTSSGTITLRFAGGWVRDKLLKIDSSDIDVSIDSMTGEKFASVFCSFVKQKGIPVSSVAVLAARPDQSKHLETACLSIFGQKLDFVNLRSEMYSETSRIPTRVVFGSPTDDAHRRDITINSLFYNIHTGKVEDWTGRGLRDLSMGLIRTPLPPASIFTDDPLRILRVVRFASRFSYKIDPEIVSSLINNPKVRNLLSEKISRERIGIEIKKMLTGPNPFLSLSLIWNLQIWSCVFWNPLHINNLNENSRFGNSLSEYECHTMQKGWIYCQILEKVLKRIPLFVSFPKNGNVIEPRELGKQKISFPFVPELIFLLYLSAIFLPHQGFVSHKSSSDKLAKVSVATFLCKYALKMTNIEEEHISAVVENSHYFTELYTSVGSKNMSAIGFDKLCSCLRLIGPRWESAWILAQVIVLERQLFSSIQTAMTANEHCLLAIDNSFIDNACVSFAHIHRQILEYGLDKLWTLKPLLNGTQIIKLFRFPKGNSSVQRLLCELVVWQIRQNITEPNIENTAQASVFLQDLYQAHPEMFTSTSYPIKRF